MSSKWRTTIEQNTLRDSTRTGRIWKRKKEINECCNFVQITRNKKARAWVFAKRCICIESEEKKKKWKRRCNGKWMSIVPVRAFGFIAMHYRLLCLLNWILDKAIASQPISCTFIIMALSFLHFAASTNVYVVTECVMVSWEHIIFASFIFN